MKANGFAKRWIHLDFHTGPDIPDVGKDFDGEEFAAIMDKARIDACTVFAKCHHGHLYYETDHPARHPHLTKGLNLLGDQIEALRQRGIRAPIYLSIQCDEYAANTHPEWIALHPDGRQVKHGGPFNAAWQILDMSSPYQDYLADQLAEVLKRFAPVDGIFMDMCWDQPSVSKWAVDGMRRKGYCPQDEGDRAKYAREVAMEYMARYKKMVDQAHKGRAVNIWFNSRPKTNLHVEKKFLHHIEVECLPTGGWGYAYFPYVARYVRPFNLPTLSMTARFHKSWADFGGLKPEAALKYECSQTLAQGMSCSIGDQLHPRGRLDKAAYELIGDVYRHIEKCEPWVEDGRIVSQIAVMIDPELGDQPGPCGLGVIRALQQLQHQFDLLPPSADLRGYELVIAPENIKVDAALAKKLSQYLKSGGALLVAGAAALDGHGKPALKELGIEAGGLSPYTTTYLRLDGAIAKGIADADHVMYEKGFRMTPAKAAKGAKALCRVVEPYFERAYDHFCSHRQTPPDKLSRWAAIVQNGRAITFSVPIFTAYGAHGNIPYRQILAACIDRLLPRPLVRCEGPAHLETSVVRKDKSTIVHLISYCPQRRVDNLDIVEEPFPLVDMPLAVRFSAKPRRIILAPAGKELPFDYKDGYARMRVTVLDGHALVVIESRL